MSETIGVQAPAVASLALDIPSLTVDEWLDLDASLEIVLRRKSDGVRITFAPTRERYLELVEKGEVVFSPSEVEQLCEASHVEGAEGIVAGVVEAKRVFPSMRIGEGWLRVEQDVAGVREVAS